MNLAHTSACEELPYVHIVGILDDIEGASRGWQICRFGRVFLTVEIVDLMPICGQTV
jgi:hypothetical protein